MTFEEVVAEQGADLSDRLRQLTLAVYGRGAEIAARSG